MCPGGVSDEAKEMFRLVTKSTHKAKGIFLDVSRGIEKNLLTVSSETSLSGFREVSFTISSNVVKVLQIR